MRGSLKRQGRWLGALAGALALAGCAAMDVSSYVQRGTSLERMRTFDWGPAAERATGDPRLDNNEFFDRRVRERVEAELTARGFERSFDAPDVLVHYHASVTQEIDVRELDREYQRDPSDRRPYVYDEGTLFLDLVEPGTGALVWRGWAEGSIAGAVDDQEWMEARIDEAVARIMARLPVALMK
jgi:hypothetical protein